MLRKRNSNAGSELTQFEDFHAQLFQTTLTSWFMLRMSTTTDLFVKTEKNFLFKSKLSFSQKWTRICLFLMLRMVLTSTQQAKRIARIILRRYPQILVGIMMKTFTSLGLLMDQLIKIVAKLSQLPVVMKMTLAIIQLKPRFLKTETQMYHSMTFKSRK